MNITKSKNDVRIDNESHRILPNDPKQLQTYMHNLHSRKEEMIRMFANMRMKGVGPEPIVDVETVPESYSCNSKTEKNLITFAESVIQNFKDSYPDRPEPLLTAFNECGVKKSIVTYLSRTDLPYCELFEWESCAKFIADYLNYCCLESPLNVPFMIVSPGYSVQRQEGNSLDFCMILYSLLASHYDVYIVRGYASCEICEMDERNKPCPLLEQEKMEAAKSDKKIKLKYYYPPWKEPVSKYDELLQEKKMIEMAKQNEKQEFDESERKILTDPLNGLRVHFWLLIKARTNEILKDFFIEPSTAESIEIDCSSYQYIESVWNATNVWINLHDKNKSRKGFYFDFENKRAWMTVYPTTVNRKSDENILDEIPIVIPISWTQPFVIKNKDFYKRYPKNQIERYYKCVKYEEFTPFILEDGLTTRVTLYSDTN